MHGTLIDSHGRVSLVIDESNALSSSEHTLTAEEQLSKTSNVDSGADSSSIINSTQPPPYLNNAVTVHHEKETKDSSTHSNHNFFRWAPGYRHVMLTFVTICIFAFVTGVEYAVILPTVYDYVRTLTSANIYVGLVLSSYSITGAITGIVMGKISDSTGKVKILMLTATIFEIGGNILYFIANNIYIVLCGRLIAGVGMGVVPPILADVAHRTTEDERTKAISIILGCRQLGLLIGPCFTLLIRLMDFQIGSIRIYYLNGPGFLMACTWVILIVVCWFCFYDRKSSTLSATKKNTSIEKLSTNNTQQNKYKRSDHVVRKGKPCVAFITYCNQYARIEVLVLFLGTFITYFNQTALETIVSAFTEKNFHWTTVHISILFAFAGLEILIVYGSLVKIFSNRLQDRTLLVLGFMSLTLACIIGTYFTMGSHIFHWFKPTDGNTQSKYLLSLFVIFVMLDLLGLPFIAATSVSLVTKLTTEKLQGFSQGLQRFIMGTGTIVGPLFASSLLNHLHIMMATMLSLTLLTLIAIFIAFKRLYVPIKKKNAKKAKNISKKHKRKSLLEPDDSETTSSPVLPKSVYITLVPQDGEENERLLEKTSNPIKTNCLPAVNSNSDRRSQSSLQNDNSSQCPFKSDEQNHTLNNHKDITT